MNRLFNLKIYEYKSLIRNYSYKEVYKIISSIELYSKHQIAKHY